MTRYFKQYIDSSNEIEIDKARALEHIGLVYKHPARVLRCLPLGWNIKVGWCYYKKAQTK